MKPKPPVRGVDYYRDGSNDPANFKNLQAAAEYLHAHREEVGYVITSEGHRYASWAVVTMLGKKP